MVIVSLGMTLILVFGTQALAGPTNVSYTMSQGATVKPGSIELTVVQLVIIALSIVVMLLRARADPLHAAGQGDARHRGQPRPGPQLRDPHRPRGDVHLADQRRAVRPGRA